LDKELNISISELVKAQASLKVGVQLLKKSVENKDIEEIRLAFRDACIQRFEYTMEFSWKLSMKVLGSLTAATKPAIREMARNNLIDNPEKWMQFLESRNETSHAYDEEIAIKVYQQIELFIPEVDKLIIALDKIQK
jgi:nucleotidyltransferase substrate binding protein (TIGR01987 family)